MVKSLDETEAATDARSISPKISADDLTFDLNLRPRGFDEYIGQEQVKENLKVAIDAARGRGDVLDHLLFHGPPGLGKTSLAYIRNDFIATRPRPILIGLLSSWEDACCCRQCRQFHSVRR